MAKIEKKYYECEFCHNDWRETRDVLPLCCPAAQDEWRKQRADAQPVERNSARELLREVLDMFEGNPFRTVPEAKRKIQAHLRKVEEEDEHGEDN